MNPIGSSAHCSSEVWAFLAGSRFFALELNSLGLIVQANAAWRSFGFNPEELPQTHFSTMVHHGSTELSNALGALQPGQRVAGDLTIRREPEGLGCLRYEAVRTDKGTFLLWGTDHTNELANRQRLLETERELDSFVYTVSHDLRAPLRAMQGFSEALLEDNADQLDDMGKDYARRIFQSGKYMDALLKGLLTHSRIGRLDFSPGVFSLQACLEQAVGESQAMLESTQATLEIKNELPPVHGDQQLIVLVFAELIANACKFVRPGTPPKIEIGLHPDDKADRVQAYIQDNGIGIAREYHERIFKVFERLHSAEEFPGTGIGLALVRKAMKVIGGEVQLVHSESGKGSRFLLTFRAAKE
jgi:signal transduction histidine kinase